MIRLILLACSALAVTQSQFIEQSDINFANTSFLNARRNAIWANCPTGATRKIYWAGSSKGPYGQDETGNPNENLRAYILANLQIAGKNAASVGTKTNPTNGALTNCPVNNAVPGYNCRDVYGDLTTNAQSVNPTDVFLGPDLLAKDTIDGTSYTDMQVRSLACVTAAAAVNTVTKIWTFDEVPMAFVSAASQAVALAAITKTVALANGMGLTAQVYFISVGSCIGYECNTADLIHTLSNCYITEAGCISSQLIPNF